MPTRPSILERDVLRSALAVLRALGFRPSRRNVGAVEAVSKSGRRRLVRFGEPGQADITATCPSGPNRGKRVEIEVKRPDERPRPEQVAFLRSVNESGGIALWIDDAGELARVLRRVLDGATIEVDDAGQCWIVTTDD
jgi:hypothetical protein